MKDIIKLLRPHQWIKNILILFPLFFGLRIKEIDLLVETAIVAVCFSFVASAIYILNDTMDREADRAHPVKKNRPIASGKVSVKTGVLLMIGLLTVGLGGIAYINIYSLFLTAGYLVMNILYSIKLKHIPILDISIIAVGFVLRIYTGAVVGDIAASHWIIIMTFLLALFIALAKRRDDVLLSIEGQDVRKAIDGYNLEFINGGMMVMASVTIVAYISYTVSEKVTTFLGAEKLYLSTLFVIVGILRYMQITFVQKKSGSPTKILLKDIFLQLTLIGWIVTLAILIYVG